MNRVYESIKKVLIVASLIGVVTLCSCSKDDDPAGFGDTSQNTNAGQNNYSDIAVTGSVTEITTISATLNGFINIDLAPVIDGQSKYEMGFCLTTEEDWTEKDLGYYYTSNIIGRSISVEVKNLSPDTRYYYHAFFQTNVGGNTKTWRGETLSFTTQNFANQAQVELVATSLHAALFKINVDEVYYENVPYNDQDKHWGVAIARSADEFRDNGNYSIYFSRTGYKAVYTLISDLDYYYCPVTRMGSVDRFGKVGQFRTEINNPYISAKIAQDSVKFTSVVVDVEAYPPMAVSNYENTIGVEISTDVNFNGTINLRHETASGKLDANSFRVEVKGLESNTTYYVRPYSIVGNPYFYGEPISFTTLDANNLVYTGSASYSIYNIDGFSADYLNIIFNGEIKNIYSFVPQNYGIAVYPIWVFNEPEIIPDDFDPEDKWGIMKLKGNNLRNGQFSCSTAESEIPFHDYWMYEPGNIYLYKAYVEIDGENYYGAVRKLEIP